MGLLARIRQSILGEAGAAGVNPMARWAARVMQMDAGRPGLRGDPDFTPAGLGPNAVNDAYLDLARRRGRELSINNPLICGARGTITDNVVGTGIWPGADTGFPELDKRLNDEFMRLAEGVDPDREIPLDESQALFLGEIFDAGDVLVHHPFVPGHRGFTAGPAIELIAAERLDLLNDRATMANGRHVRHGVQMDAMGRVDGYWVLNEHPSDGGMAFAAGSRFVPATRATLGFIRRRAGQIRGVPTAAAAMVSTRMEEGLLEAVLVQARACAINATYFEGLDPKDWWGQDDERLPVDLATGEPAKRAEPGRFIALPAGVKPHVQGHNIPSPQFSAAEEIQLRRIAAALRISYAALARDYSKATFSATRAEQLEDRRAYRRLQRLVWHAHTRGFWQDFVTTAMVRGAVKTTAPMREMFTVDPMRICRCRVRYSGWEWVNPDQEAKANHQALMDNVTSEERIILALGGDPDQVLEERVRFVVNLARRVSDAAASSGVEESLIWSLLRPSTTAPAAGGGEADDDKDDEDAREDDDEDARGEDDEAGDDTQSREQSRRLVMGGVA